MALLIVALLLMLLSACSAPVRAPVVSRESGHAVSTVKRNRPAIRRTWYRVRAGDTLYSIAWRFGLEYRQLAAWNHVRYPYTIYPGKLLRLKPPVASRKPPARARGSRSKTPAKTADSGSNRTSFPTKKRKPASNGSVEKILKLRWTWPTRGKLLQGFSRTDPARKGIKIGGQSGQPVVAAESGKVVYAGSGLLGYGRLIIIKHNRNYLSAYGYNKKIRVKEGQTVKRGERIADMGRMGNGSPTLHFEIRRNGRPVDPMGLLPRR